MEFFNIDGRLLETAKKAEEMASEQFAKNQRNRRVQRKQGALRIYKQPCQRNAS